MTSLFYDYKSKRHLFTVRKDLNLNVGDSVERNKALYVIKVKIYEVESNAMFYYVK